MPGIQDARAKVGDLVRRMGTRLRREQASETPKPQTSAQQPPVAAPRAPIAARPGAQPVTRPVTPPPASAGSAARADATRTTDGKDTPAKDPAAKAPLPPARSTPADNAKPPIAPVSGGTRPASASETDSTTAIAARPAPGTQDVAPGGPAFENWELTRNVQSFLTSAKQSGTEKDITTLVSVTPAAAIVKGTDGSDWAVVCVLADVRAAITVESRMGYGWCQRMQWIDGRWMIAAGAAPAAAPSVWPGSALAIDAGWLTWTQK